MAVSWLILACAKGAGGPINSVLSWGLFAPLARLSYCMYLIHITLLFWIISLPSYTVTITVSVVVYYIIAVMFVTTAGSYALVMVFEAPLMHMEKMLYAVVGAGKMPQIRKNQK